MAKILYRQSLTPATPSAVTSGSAVKGTPLTMDEGDYNYKALNDDIQTRAPLSGANFTGPVTLSTALAISSGGTGSTTAQAARTNLGLGNVDNTSDANKPISTATQTALNGKQGTLVSGTNIKTINGQSILGPGNVPVGDVYGPASATDNAIVRFDGTTGKLVQNSNVFVDDSGNVGIGAAADPGVRLHVRSSTARIQGDVCSIGFSSANAVNNWYAGANVSDSGDGGFVIGQGLNVWGGTPRFAIDYHGNVGIGVTPADRLDVAGGIRQRDIHPRIIQVNGNSIEVTEIGVGVLTGYGDSIGINNKTPSGLISFGTNNTERMRIEAGGNVGIGTSSPSSRLHVIGDLRTQGNFFLSTVSTGQRIYPYYFSATNHNYIGAESDGSLSFGTGVGDVSERVRINSSGAVGIGKTSPGAKLDWRDTINVVSTATTAVASNTYVLTASMTLTLPAGPIAGDWVRVVNRSGTLTCVIARNGQNIMGLAEDMTLDNLNASTVLIFADATRGWIWA